MVSDLQSGPEMKELGDSTGVLLGRCVSWVFRTFCALVSLPASGDEAAFFQVDSPAACQLVGFRHDGHLVWSNSAGSGAYSILRRFDLPGGDWRPFAKGYLAEAGFEMRVMNPRTYPGYVFLPGEFFRMGDALGDHNNITRPVREICLSPFFAKRTEVTNMEMRDVLQWAFGGGLIVVTNKLIQDLRGTNLMDISKYDAEMAFADGMFTVRSGREPCPAARVSWYGAAAYCNFRSAMDGMDPCYDLENWSCDFSRNGYRLPTEAEWEYAARGGHDGLRFPWGHTNVITHSLANYKSDSSLNWYDVSPTQGFHPDYADHAPRSSPVGTFAPNDFGLSDMCGNVLEWVHDWYARYVSGTQTNPAGPVTGTYRVVRGGSWYTTAERATCSVRFSFIGPDRLIEDVGFRTVFRDSP